jgi:uncharacterized protein (TIGR03085 family)
MPTPAAQERQRFAEELTAVGPDAATLCEGWTARDLAAHIVLRDGRPDAAMGLVVSAASGYTDKVQSKIAAGDWDELVDRVRNGPPVWSPTRIGKVERLVNSVEFFVHLEDVRRAQPGWTARGLDAELVDDLNGALGRIARLYARKAPAGITLAPDDGREPVVANEGEPMVTVTGPIGELVLFMNGRQAHALVELDGPADAVAALQSASFGI